MSASSFLTVVLNWRPDGALSRFWSRKRPASETEYMSMGAICMKNPRSLTVTGLIKDGEWVPMPVMCSIDKSKADEFVMRVEVDGVGVSAGREVPPRLQMRDAERRAHGLDMDGWILGHGSKDGCHTISDLAANCKKSHTRDDPQGIHAHVSIPYNALNLVYDWIRVKWGQT